MNIDKVLFHLKEADKELNKINTDYSSNKTYSYQSYLEAMSNVYDFVLSIKPEDNSNDVIRDDY